MRVGRVYIPNVPPPPPGFVGMRVNGYLTTTCKIMSTPPPQHASFSVIFQTFPGIL